MKILNRTIDERFLNHRRQSTSLAGIFGGITAICLFAYHLYFDHRWSWDLFAVGMAIVGIKLIAMTWYTLRD